MVQKSIDGLCRLFGLLMVACLALMVVMVFGNVVLRYGFNSGITVSEELSRWLFVWMTFLGAVVAVRKHSHLGTDMLISRLPPRGKKACYVAAHLLMLYMCWLMGSGGWQQTLINYGTTSAAMEVSMAWFYVSGVMFAVLASIIIVHELYKLLTGQVAEDELIAIAESDDMPTGEQARPITIFLGALLGAMALGVPIAFSLLACGAALMWHMNMFDPQILAQNTIEGANSFPLLAVPFFMLAGEIMNAGGLSARIVKFAMTLVGHVRGGLGYVGIMAAIIMAALSGSAVADAAALAALLLPMMNRAGYDTARSAGLLSAASIIAPIIPPSIGFVVFGVAANVSISKLFMAGIVPGLILGLALWITWWLLVRKENIQPTKRASRQEVVAAFRDATFALGMPIIVVVGLKFGVFTPTEAAVVAAVYALFVSMVIYRELKLSQLYGLFLAAAQTTAIIMFLVAAAMVSAWMITVANLPGELVALLRPLLDQPTMLMFMIMVVTMLVGTAMDMTPTILILTPVFMPLVKAAGIDPVYFGVLFIINNAIGLITPPVGTVLSTVAGVGKVSMDEVTKGVWPFMVAQFIVMFLMVFFPGLVTIPAHWFYR